MDLNNKTLVDWLKDAPSECYPQRKEVDYFTHYKKLKDYLNDNVHKEVTIGANLKDPDILLNDHGPEHIETVISRASYLVDCESCTLNPYEVYLLLCSIELHDVGNIFGRYQHELNVDEIMLEASGICGRDHIEAIIIKEIAQAHGGKLESGSKDKISLLSEEEEGFEDKYRPQLLASILRFADELADDKNRANSQLLVKGRLPKKSEVFHAYAMCLDSVKINHIEKAVNLSFKIPKDFLLRTFGKIEEEVMLVDEIYDRLMKMHYERIYTMRFCKNVLEIESISVRIQFFDKIIKDVFPRISFTLNENGYPKQLDTIYEICDDLNDKGEELNGEHIKSKVEAL